MVSEPSHLLKSFTEPFGNCSYSLDPNPPLSPVWLVLSVCWSQFLPGRSIQLRDCTTDFLLKYSTPQFAGPCLTGTAQDKQYYFGGPQQGLACQGAAPELTFLGMKTHNTLSPACSYSISPFCSATTPKSCIYTWHKEWADILLKLRQQNRHVRHMSAPAGQQRQQTSHPERAHRAWDLPWDRWKQTGSITWALDSGFFW